MTDERIENDSAGREPVGGQLRDPVPQESEVLWKFPIVLFEHDAVHVCACGAQTAERDLVHRILASVEKHVLRFVLPHRTFAVRVFTAGKCRRRPCGERGLALASLPDDKADLSLRNEP